MYFRLNSFPFYSSSCLEYKIAIPVFSFTISRANNARITIDWIRVPRPHLSFIAERCDDPNHVTVLSYFLFSLIIITRCVISSFMFSFTCTWDSDIKFSIRYLFSRAWEDFRTCCREPSCHPIKVTRIILRFTDPWRNFYVSLFGFYFNGIFIIWIGVGQSRYVWRLLQSQHAISTRCSTGVSFPQNSSGS